MESVFLVPILISLGAFAMIFGIVYLRTRENLAMLEKGFNPKDSRVHSRPSATLKAGLLLIGAGTGLLAAYIIDQSLPRVHNTEAIYFSLLAIGGGLGLVASYSKERKDHERRKSELQ